MKQAIDICSYPYAKRLGGSALPIIEYYKSCKELMATAKHFNTEWSTIKRILIANGVSLYETQFRPNKEEELQIVQMYQSKKSIKEVAERFNCSEELVSRVLKSHNIKVRPREKAVFKIDPNSKEIIERYDSIKEAAQKYCNVGKACNKFPNKKCHGFLWMKEEDYDKFWVNGLPSW